MTFFDAIRHRIGLNTGDTYVHRSLRFLLGIEELSNVQSSIGSIPSSARAPTVIRNTAPKAPSRAPSPRPPVLDEAASIATTYEVTVIGLGLSGSITALEMAQKYKVLALERGKHAIPGESTTYAASNKLHTGVHYPRDITTAVHCLRGTIKFIRKYPTYVLDHQNPDAPSRRGMHYFMSNTDLGLDREEVVAFCEQLRGAYKKLIEDDPENKVLGEVDDFIQYVEPDACPSHIAREVDYEREDGTTEKAHLLLGVKTHESQIDLKTFSAYLQEQLEGNSNITLRFNTTVKSMAYQSGSLDYTVNVVDTRQDKPRLISYATQGVVNCAWHEAENIDKTIGFFDPTDNMCIRAKASVVVTLPKSLRDAGTCIFSSGAHASFTTQRNTSIEGEEHIEAIVTYEPATNVMHYKAGSHVTDPKLLDLYKPTRDGAPNPQRVELAKRIVAGAAKYIPELANYTKAELRIGFVKMQNPSQQEISLFKRDSIIHKRTDYGTKVLGLCVVKCDGTKMCLIVDNMDQLGLLMDDQFRVRARVVTKARELDEALKRNQVTKTSIGPQLTTVIYNTIRHTLVETGYAALHVSASTYQADLVSGREKALKPKLILTLSKRSLVLSELCGELINSPPLPEPRLFPIYEKNSDGFAVKTGRTFKIKSR